MRTDDVGIEVMEAGRERCHGQRIRGLFTCMLVAGAFVCANAGDVALDSTAANVNYQLVVLNASTEELPSIPATLAAESIVSENVSSFE